MKYTFHSVDVFSSTPFGGNQLAVMPDAAGISTEGMQKIAREFNFGETTFVLPKNDPPFCFAQLSLNEVVDRAAINRAAWAATLSRAWSPHVFFFAGNYGMAASSMLACAHPRWASKKTSSTRASPRKVKVMKLLLIG